MKKNNSFMTMRSFEKDSMKQIMLLTKKKTAYINEWINQRMNEWTNEWMNELIS